MKKCEDCGEYKKCDGIGVIPTGQCAWYHAVWYKAIWSSILKIFT